MQCVQVQSNAQSTHVTLIHVHSNFATTHNVYDNFVGVRSNFAPSSQQLRFRFVKYEILSVPTVMPVLYVSVAILSRLQNSVKDRLPWRIHWLNLGGGGSCLTIRLKPSSKWCAEKASDLEETGGVFRYTWLPCFYLSSNPRIIQQAMKEVLEEFQVVRSLKVYWSMYGYSTQLRNRKHWSVNHFRWRQKHSISQQLTM